MIKSISNKLFLLNVFIILFIILLKYFWDVIGLNYKDNIYFALLCLIIYGLSSGGIFTGLKEIKSENINPILGLIGNGILTIFLWILFYSSAFN